MLFILGALIGAAVVIFMLQNIIPVTVMFLAWQVEGSLAFIVLLAVIAGMLISALLSIPSMIRSQMKVSALKKHNKKLAEDLETHKELLQKAPVVEQSTPESGEVVVEKVTIVETTEEIK